MPQGSNLRCPECGGVYKPGELSQPSLPWFKREQIGLLRAFFLTTLKVLLQPWRLVRDLTHTIDDRSCRLFLNLTVIPTALIFGVGLSIAIARFASPTNPFIAMYLSGDMMSYSADLLLPFLSGGMQWGLGPAAAALIYIFFRGFPFPFILIRRHDGASGPSERALRAASLSRFAAATLWPFSIWAACAAYLAVKDFTDPPIVILTTIPLLYSVFLFFCIPAVLLRKAGASWTRTFCGGALLLLVIILKIITVMATWWFAGYAILTREILRAG